MNRKFPKCIEFNFFGDCNFLGQYLLGFGLGLGVGESEQRAISWSYFSLSQQPLFSQVNVNVVNIDDCDDDDDDINAPPH